MAEAIVNHHLNGSWNAYSAGSHPSGYVHPKSIQVLAELGIVHQGRSKHVEELRDVEFELVVTVCDSAAEECPVWLGPEKRVHMAYPDPADATGTEEEILAVFRQVRDDIADQIPNLLATWVS
jgi:arsenate reductase